MTPAHHQHHRSSLLPTAGLALALLLALVVVSGDALLSPAAALKVRPQAPNSSSNHHHHQGDASVPGKAPVITTASYFRGQLRETGGGWPACDPTVPQWSGYFDTPGRGVNPKHYFYWAFGPRAVTAGRAPPVILWMTGGPGCSSTFALLTEVGPCLANSTSDAIEHNREAWNNEAYLIFIDQPLGVGFSHGDAIDENVNSWQVGDDMLNFVQAFLTAHPELRESDFFVVGESYGGHYAPATAHRILLSNEALEGPAIKLAGMATGNGLTDAYHQYAAYPDMAYNYCRDKLGAPCVSASAHQEMLAAVPRCQSYIRSCNFANSTPSADACRQAGWVCNALAESFMATGLNPYDITKECGPHDLCYDTHAVDDFMNRADVQTALGVDPGTPWESCNMKVNGQFGIDWFKNLNSTIPPLLAAGVRVLVYSGDLDFIVNFIGSERWTSEVEWPGRADFITAREIPFSDATGRTVGLVRGVPSADGKTPNLFACARIFDAGHMVPTDQPEAASRLIANFIFNRRFSP